MSNARVLIKFNMAIIKEVPIDKPEVTFGRKSTNDIVLDNQAVSGSHGKFKQEGAEVVLYDVGSTNGTFLNGRKISKDSLKNKDQIRVARYVLEFLSDDPAHQRPADQPAPIDPEIHQETVNHQKDILRQSLGLPVKGDPPQPDAIKPVITPTPPPQPVAEPTPAPAEVIPQQMGAHLKGDRVLPPPSGVVKIISGAAEEKTEYKLTELTTFIGTGNQALIKIKGFMAPDLAAAISRRPDGYFLKAVKAGYPKVNGISVKDQVFLESGALLEVGGTNMVFYINDPAKNASK